MSTAANSADLGMAARTRRKGDCNGGEERTAIKKNGFGVIEVEPTRDLCDCKVEATIVSDWLSNLDEILQGLPNTNLYQY